MTEKEEKALLDTVKKLEQTVKKLDKDNKVMKADLDNARQDRKRLNSVTIKQASEIRALKQSIQVLSKSRR